MKTADIRPAYINAGMSRREFAKHIGIAEGTVRRIEGGEAIHPSSAKKVADFLGCKVTDLMSVDPLDRAA